jgi:TolB-like protein/class 3 adenylate cyclase/Tfp pilus assembly protein PilF
VGGASIERRLAAILAADVVGYSRLMEADDADTHVRLKALRKEFIEPRIAEHHGRIVKLTGDGALVEFGSVVEAVLCAVAVQRIVTERNAEMPLDQRIEFRIGVNLGDVIFDENDIYGDGVNVAARLQTLAEPGGICLSRTVYNHVKNKVRLAFEPMGEHKVRNIAEPITVYRVLPGSGGAASISTPVAPALGRHRPGAVAAAVVMLLAAGAAGAWYALWWPNPDVPASAVAEAEAKPALPLPDKPSIAVLPFENLSGDPKQERLAGGLTEDVITDLSRFRDLFVIARNSTEVYKGKPVDVRQVAYELGVQYVLEGSLQTDGERVRITAQLVNGATGNHVWAERYDRPLEDVFVVQDEVTQRIAGSVSGYRGAIARTDIESSRRKSPRNLQAYDYYLLGIEHKHRFTEEGNEKAKTLLNKAIENDPTLARAYVALAWVYQLEIDNGWGGGSVQEAMVRWRQAAQAAVTLDPADGQTHAVLGTYHMYLSEFDRALVEYDKALSLSPNDAEVLREVASNLPWLGKPEQALETIERSMRLNPYYEESYYNPVRSACYFTGQYEKAIATIKKKKEVGFFDQLFLTMSHAQLGQEEEAAHAAAELLQRDPDHSAEQFISNVGGFARDVELNLFLDGHREAKLPLCATEAQLEMSPDMTRLPQCDAERARS